MKVLLLSTPCALASILVAYRKSAVVHWLLFARSPKLIGSFFGLSILSLCGCPNGRYTFLAGTLGWVFVSTMSSSNMGYQFCWTSFLLRYVASFRRVGVGSTLVKSCVWAYKYLLFAGSLCVYLGSSRVFISRIGWALVVKLVVFDRTYIGLCPCACLYITR